MTGGSTLPLSAMYQERILAHFRTPHGRGLPTDGATRVGERRNPLCGDAIRIGAVLDGARVAAVGFDGSGCSIATASASMLTEAVRGRSVEEVHAIADAVERLLRGEPVPEAELPGDLPALAGVARHPQRIGCARLPWQALADALVQAAAPSPTAPSATAPAADIADAAQELGTSSSSNSMPPVSPARTL